MNSVERVFAAVEGKTADRPAVTLTLSLYGAKLLGCPIYEYYTNSNNYADGQSAIFDTFQPDILFTPFALASEGESFGSEIKYVKNYAPNLSKPAIKSIEEISRLKIPDIDSHPRLLFIRESLRLMVSRYGGNVPIAAILLSPIDLPALIMGIDAWLETLLFNKSEAQKLIDITSEFFIIWANTLLSDGANILLFPCNFSNPNIVTENILREYAIPIYEKIFKEIKGPMVIHHGGARLEPFIEYYNSLPNVAAFVIDSCDSFTEVRKKVGSTRLLIGNIDGPTLINKSPESIYDECTKLLTDRSEDKHFIMASSNADIAFDTPAENIKAMIQAAKDHKYVESL